MLKDELKPCPFCGRKKIHVGIYFQGPGYAECEKCGAKIERKTVNYAIKAWNRRMKNAEG